MAKKFLIGLVAGLLLLGTISISEGTLYVAATDFSINNGNPNGTWSYGWMPVDLSTFNLYTGTVINNHSPAWYREPAVWNYAPIVWRNDWNVAMYGVAVGQLALHPDYAFEPSVVRWTAPSDGDYYMYGGFLPGDGGVMQVGILQGSTWLWQGIDAGAFAFDRSMTAGESIDFLVGGAYYNGNTPLELTISDSAPDPWNPISWTATPWTPIPGPTVCDPAGECRPPGGPGGVTEPTTMLLLGLGLMGLAGVRRKLS